MRHTDDFWPPDDGQSLRTKKLFGNDQIYNMYNLQGQLVHISSPEGATHYIYLGKQQIAKLSPNAEYKDKSGYTGHLEDKDIDLTYMQQRYYDPVIGRFYSNDPVGFTADKPMMFNRYAYANNNPYKYTDPDGREAIDRFNDAFSNNPGEFKALEPYAIAATSFMLMPSAGLLSFTRQGAVFNFNRTGHIFRNAEGHVNPSSTASQVRFARLFENVTKSGKVDSSVLSNFQRKSGEFVGYSKEFKNGTVWTQTKDGQIVNAGVNRGTSATADIPVVRIDGRLDSIDNAKKLKE